MSQTRCDVITATSLATQASVAKQQPNVNGVGKTNMKSSVMDPRYALTAINLKVNGKRITDKKQIANLLVSTISKNSSSQHYSPKFQAIKKQNEKKPVKFT